MLIYVNINIKIPVEITNLQVAIAWLSCLYRHWKTNIILIKINLPITLFVMKSLLEAVKINKQSSVQVLTEEKIEIFTTSGLGVDCKFAIYRLTIGNKNTQNNRQTSQHHLFVGLAL